MRYAADEKLEIIRLVENSHLGVKRTLDKLGVARPTFYRWYARYQTRGEVGLNNRYLFNCMDFSCLVRPH